RRRLTDVEAVARGPVRVIERAEKTGLARQVIDDLDLVPDVVPRGHAIDAAGEELLAELGGDAEPVGGILDVRHDEIDRARRDEPRQLRRQDVPPGAAVDVSQESDAHASNPRL